MLLHRMLQTVKYRCNADEAAGSLVSRPQVFTLFKSSRTHMMLACCLKEPAPELPPGKQSVLSVRSQQNFLSKSMKQVTGVITLEDGEPRAPCCQRLLFVHFA